MGDHPMEKYNTPGEEDNNGFYFNRSVQLNF
jgi:hypothetical protein